MPAPKLWRLLIAKPRPWLELDFRIRGAEDIPLHVRGLRCVEEGAIYDAVADVEPDEVRTSRFMLEYVSFALYAGQERVFDSAGAVGQLHALELTRLGSEVLRALSVISPSFARSERDPWMVKLCEGAKATFNIHEAALMADSADVVLGKEAYPLKRPDRYFGMPVSELTDGQLMAFHAGVKVIKELRGHTE